MSGLTWKYLRKLLWLLAGFILAYLVVRIVRETMWRGHDFEVFYRTVRYMLNGEEVYSIARDNFRPFKYPPWILPGFVPVALLPYGLAKFAWALIQILCLLYTALWLKRQNCSPAIITFVTIAFGGIFIVHAMDAQINLPFMALMLAAARPSVFTFWLATIKVFTVFPLLEFLRKEFRSQIQKKIVLSFGAFLILSLPAVWVSKNHDPIELIQEYTHVASSGGKEFSKSKVRWRENQGFPALVLRKMAVPSKNTQADSITALAFFVVLGGLWFFLSAQLPFAHRWTGWLALSVVIQPLAWFHTFVLVFPAATLALQQAWDLPHSRTRALALILSLLGIIMIGAVTRKTFGWTGYWLELWSIKSWGTLICVSSLYLFHRRGAA